MRDFSSFRRILAFALLLSANVNLFSAPATGTYSPQQMLPAGHWIYDALFMLCAEDGRAVLAANAPLSISELKMRFSEIDYESLSESGRNLYGMAMDFFSRKKPAARLGQVSFGYNVSALPELLFKSGESIDWTFATDYTGDGDNHDLSGLLEARFSEEKDVGGNGAPWDKGSYKYKADGGGYGPASSFLGNGWTQPFVTMPIYIGFADMAFIETDPFFGKSFYGMDAGNFTNIPLDFNGFEFLIPRTAYGSVGKSFGGWGFSLSVAKGGLQIGRTQTGSVICNSTFETDGYVQLALYSPQLRYVIDTIQISPYQFMYLHQLEVRPVKWFSVGVFEGTMVDRAFELRFLNPLMVMHSFSSWNDRLSEDEERYYGRARNCAYAGLYADFSPCKYLRLYGLYAQNELQLPNELLLVIGRTMPDSLGVQFGAEVAVPERRGGWWLCGAEGIFTSPFMYIKEGSDWSLYRKRFDMMKNVDTPICSWIGTPFGPDARGLQVRLKYNVPQKWHSEISYLFVAHGENSFGLFDNTVSIGGKAYSAYYPTVLYKMGAITAEEAEKVARSYSLTGIIQYTNQIALAGGYSFNGNFSLNGRAVYSFIFNNGNESGRFDQGLELAMYLSYTLF